MTPSRHLLPVLVFIALGMLIFTEMPAPNFGPTSGVLFDGTRSVHDSIENFCLAALDVAASGNALVFLLVTAIPVGLVSLLATWFIVVQIVSSRRLSTVLQANEISPLPASLCRAAARAGLRDRVRLVESTDFSAFCFGLFRPDAWISTAALDALGLAELEAVLRHEAWHVRQRDPLKVLIANAGSTAVGFFPFVRQRTKAYLLDRELQADAAVVHEMEDSYPLASALHRAASVARRPLPATAGAFNSIDARIDQLLDDVGPGTVGRPSVAACLFGALGGVAPTAVACVLVTPV